MKLKNTLTIALFLPLILFGQVPQRFQYQTVVREATGNILVNKIVSFRISILENTITGPSVYSETHTSTTNQFGLSNLQIGGGQLVSGNFSAITWGANLHYIKIELDPTGGTTYELMGTSQLLSVPYSLHSATADSIKGATFLIIDE